MYKEEINGKPVAVRLSSSEFALDELKVIDRVGDHPHVVRFIGMFFSENPITGLLIQT